MNKQPKVSIIIPIYNKEDCLRRTLDSVVHQTLKDIEIICVDDGSTDGSRAIIDEYAQRDERIVKIYHEANLGTSQARKDGVLASTGEYVMFLDADDAFKLNACEAAYAAVESTGADIVHFETDVKNCTENSAPLRGFEKFSPMSSSKIEGELLQRFWSVRKFGWILFNKIYLGTLVRKAFREVEDGYLVTGEDRYALFIILFYARSYMGIADKLYEYNFGRGITGQKVIKIEHFKKFLEQKKVIDALHRFARAKSLYEEYVAIIDEIDKIYLNQCTALWVNEVAENDRADAFEELVKTFGLEDVISCLAQKHWDLDAEFCKKFVNLPLLQHQHWTDGKKLTIGVYGWRATMGGTEHVSVMLCNRFAEEKDEFGNDKYNVVLITDGEKQPGEYSLSPKVKRAYLPAYETSVRERYRERLQAWRSIISEHDIDIVDYGLFWSACQFWDMLAIKSAPSRPAFIEHYHNCCGEPFQDAGNRASWLPYVYQISDGVVGLSECDREFFSAFNVNARCIVNPFEFQPQNTPNSDHEKNTLVWVGRLHKQKNPLDVLRMLKFVRAEVPDVMLYIVGGRNEQMAAQMLCYIEQQGLSDNVCMTGVTLDTAKYYRKASVFISTSVYEGFPLTIGEALAHGVPVVTYDMPWLTYLRDGRGIVTVPQGQYTMLADAVIKLLRDPARIRELGAQGKQMVTELANVDIMAQWDELFAAINSGTKAPPRTDSAAINYRYITLFAVEGKKAAAAAAKTQGQREARNAPAVRGFLSGRIDVKNVGEGNDVVLTDVTPGTYTEKPAWFSQNGQGAVLESTSGQMTFTVQCKGDGTLRFDLRGRCIRDAEKRALPYFVDFTSFTIDGEEKLSGRTPVWHDAPRKFEMPVADGQIVKVAAAWQPHPPERALLVEAPKKLKELDGLKNARDAAKKEAADVRQQMEQAAARESSLQRRLDETLKNVEALQAQLDLSRHDAENAQRRFEKKLAAENDKTGKLTARLAEAQQELRNIRRGTSFRLGRLLTWLPRKLTGKKW